MPQNLIRLKQLNTSELSGFFANAAANTGAFSTIISNSNLVYTSGDQTITGVKNFISRPNVNNVGLVISGEIAGLTTGAQTFSGVKTFNNTINFGSNNYISGNYINLQTTPVLNRSSNTGQILLNTKSYGIRSVLNQTDGFGNSFAYQPSLIDKNNISYYFANAGSTGTNNINFTVNTLVNANAVNIRRAINIGTTSYFDATKRIGYTGNTGINSPSSYGIAPAQSADMLYFRGVSGYGGFYLEARFGIGEMTGTVAGKARAFMGMSSLTNALVTTTQPSLRATDLLGIGFDSGDNNWFFMHNSGTSASATKISLGSNYTNLIKSGNVLELSVYAIPDSGVGFYANIANSGTIYETGYYTTTNIPARTTLLGPNFSVYNSESTVGSLEFIINGIYLESFI